jgi:hypothetical protein
MKTMILAAFAALSLGIGAANAESANHAVPQNSGAGYSGWAASEAIPGPGEG